ncbi:MAG: aldo/keto reductase [Candidatus Heimdallarchaeota archaeon]|nr:aldo/keto reductase [Candidatus Heimdallarchaeota archaeon]
MEVRTFGKTGYSASIIALGGYGIGFIEQAQANEYIELAMKKGVNIIDVAPTYGEAELRLAPFVKEHRDRFFIAEKTAKRTKEGAWEELQQSLERLQTDYFDLYQFHGVKNLEELDQIFAKDGAMAAFQEAQETGLINYIGITGHADIRVHIEALNRFDFDTVLAPINVASMAAPDPVNNFRPLLELAREKDVGVIAIKAIAKSRWTREKAYQTWYEPLDTQEDINRAVWFTLSQGGVTTYSLAGDYRLWAKVLDAAERFKPLDQEEQKEIINYANEQEFQPLFPE